MRIHVNSQYSNVFKQWVKVLNILGILLISVTMVIEYWSYLSSGDATENVLSMMLVHCKHRTLNVLGTGFSVFKIWHSVERGGRHENNVLFTPMHTKPCRIDEIANLRIWINKTHTFYVFWREICAPLKLNPQLVLYKTYIMYSDLWRKMTLKKLILCLWLNRWLSIIIQ